MKYDEFIGQVQHRARVGTQGESVRAVQATLATLSERISTGEADNLAAQLPYEIGTFLKNGRQDRFTLDEFFERVADREGVDLPVAAHHARAVISVLNEAVSAGQMDNVRGQLPEEFEPLFTSGSDGTMDR